MRFLFTGCSYCKGTDLEDRLKERWSAYFGGDNIARPGWSNDSIVRSVIEHEEGYDKVIVQLTFPDRVYHPRKDYCPSREEYTSYYEEHYEYEIGNQNFWKNVWVLKKLLGDRLVLLSIKRPPSNSWTMLAGECPMIVIEQIIGKYREFDPNGEKVRNPLYCVGRHPNAKAHKMIADKIKDVLNS